ncbi:MAG: aminotransferase class IV [Caulobacteraceae bacterium]
MDGVPLDDRGLLLADGLFETLLWKNGALTLAKAHAARMAKGAAALGLAAPSLDDFRTRAEAAVRDAGLGASRAAVRITLTAGSGGRGLERPEAPSPRLFATAAPSQRPTGAARLFVSTIRRNPSSPASRFKTLAYLDNVLARREARAAGADEGAMLSTSGELACAAAANLFWIEGGALFTPAAETGRLGGIMAGEVMTAARRLGVRMREVREGPEALARADAIFLTNSLIGLRAAYMIAPPANPHPLVERLANAVEPVA